jgi:hypothetical protein
MHPELLSKPLLVLLVGLLLYFRFLRFMLELGAVHLRYKDWCSYTQLLLIDDLFVWEVVLWFG